MKKVFVSFFLMCLPLGATEYRINLVPDDEVMAAVHAVSSNDFASAVYLAKQLISNYPASPEGHIILSFVYTTFMNYYKTTIYDDDFYSLYEESSEMLEEILEADPKNIRAKFYFGVITSYYGMMQLRNGHFFSAFVKGLKGMSHLEDTIHEDVQDPIYDSYFGLSQFYYYRNAFSKAFRWIPGVKNDLERAYNALEVAKTNGYYMKNEAVLAEFTMRLSDGKVDKNFPKRLQALREVYTNHLFLNVKLLDYYIYKQKWDKGVDAAVLVISNLDAEEKTGFGAYLQIYYKKARCYHKQGKNAEAMEALNVIRDKMVDFEDWYENDGYLKKYKKLYEDLCKIQEKAEKAKKTD